MFDFSKDYDQETVLPEGIYDAYVDFAEYKLSKSSNVEYLNLKWKTSNGAVVFAMYNLFNKNDIARNIAMSEIKKILECQGHDISKLTSLSKDGLLSSLKNDKYVKIALTIKVDDFGKKNIIKKYLPSDTKNDSSECPF